MVQQSSQGGGQLGEVRYNQIGLMRCLAEWPLTPVDERRSHAIRFCSDTVEGVIGDKQDATVSSLPAPSRASIRSRG
jgi:hypothetical protein